MALSKHMVGLATGTLSLPTGRDLWRPLLGLIATEYVTNYSSVKPYNPPYEPGLAPRLASGRRAICWYTGAVFSLSWEGP